MARTPQCSLGIVQDTQCTTIMCATKDNGQVPSIERRVASEMTIQSMTSPIKYKNLAIFVCHNPLALLVVAIQHPQHSSFAPVSNHSAVKSNFFTYLSRCLLLVTHSAATSWPNLRISLQATRIWPNPRVSHLVIL